MRQGDEVYFLHTDHLGSTSLTTDATGAPIAHTRYLPYGEQRWTDGDTPTDFTFTGQRADSFGLLDYNARYYDSGLGRFISPDTIVPNPANPQSLNRYSYVLNRPLQGGDPTGHDGPIPQVPPYPQLIDPVAVRQMADALQQGMRSAGPYAPVVTGGTVVAATLIGGTYIGSSWAMQDMGPSNPANHWTGGWTETLPLGEGGLRATSPLPGTSTLGTEGPTILTTPLNDELITFGLDFPSSPGIGWPSILKTSVIYEFPDGRHPGKTYVGQSGNIEERLKQHEEAGRYTPGTGSITPIPGSTKFDREIAEQNRINALGGLSGGNVSNQRNPIGPARREEALKRGLNPFP